MSRYELKTSFWQICLGWDKHLNTYYAQVSSNFTPTILEFAIGTHAYEIEDIEVLNTLLNDRKYTCLENELMECLKMEKFSSVQELCKHTKRILAQYKYIDDATQSKLF